MKRIRQLFLLSALILLLGVPVLGAETEVEDYLSQYAQNRQWDFSSGQSREGHSTMSSGRQAMVEDLEHRINAKILDAQVTMDILRQEEGEAGLMVTAYEWTRFTYDDLADGPGGSDEAGFGVEHEMTFSRAEDGTLTLISDSYTESDVLTGQRTYAVSDDAPAVETQPDYEENFDPVKASVYANKWVYNGVLPNGTRYDVSYYNPAYISYPGLDCTNYTSQCLYEGGMPRSAGWYPNGGAWNIATNQYRYFKPYAKAVYSPSAADIYPGSVFYYGSSNDFYHTIIATGCNSAGTPVINAHNADHYRIPWNYAGVPYVIYQFTPYNLLGLDFVKETITADKTMNVPLYAHFKDTSYTMLMPISKGQTREIITDFYLDGLRWGALYVEDVLYYCRLENGTFLGYSPEGPFLDVFASDWYFDPVNTVYEAGIFQGTGDGMFTPAGAMTRSMFVTVLSRLAGADTTGFTKTHFVDISPDQWYFTSVVWAYEKGITKGISETEFGPEVPLTREQAVTLMQRFLEVMEISPGHEEGHAAPFEDGADISPWAVESIEIMRLAGIAKGTDLGYFLPQQTLDRAQGATFMSRLLEIMKRENTP